MDFIKDLFMLRYLPQLGNDTNYGILFIFGILTSFHCIGMCGGIAISQTVKSYEIKRPKSFFEQYIWLKPSFVYNIGRVISYTLVGSVVGGIGQVISFSGIWRSFVPVISGIFMIIMAINLLGIFPVLRRLQIRIPSFVAKKVYAENTMGPLVVGILSGLMPCGPLQMVQLYALGTRSVFYGAISMFVFSVGTVPVLFLFGAVNTLINKKHSKIILRASAVFVMILGLVMINRGLALSGIKIEFPKLMGMNKVEISENVSKINGNEQFVNSAITKDSFPSITVQKGIPVRWNLHADKESLNDCNNEIIIAALRIEKKLVEGDNYLEFTPKESGTIVFTCWMGMIKSKIVVVDRLP